MTWLLPALSCCILCCYCSGEGQGQQSRGGTEGFIKRYYHFPNCRSAALNRVARSTAAMALRDFTVLRSSPPKTAHNAVQKLPHQSGEKHRRSSTVYCLFVVCYTGGGLLSSTRITWPLVLQVQQRTLDFARTLLSCNPPIKPCTCNDQ